MFGNWTLGSGGKKRSEKHFYQKILLSTAKFVQQKKNCGDFTPFISKSFQIWDHVFQLLFPKDSKSLTILDIPLLEVGAKRCLNGTSKSEQTDRQTDNHSNKLNYRKHRPRGPMLWKLCFYAKALLCFLCNLILNKALVCLCAKLYFKQSLSLTLYILLFHAKALYKMESLKCFDIKSCFVHSMTWD